MTQRGRRGRRGVQDRKTEERGCLVNLLLLRRSCYTGTLTSPAVCETLSQETIPRVCVFQRFQSELREF